MAAAAVEMMAAHYSVLKEDQGRLPASWRDTLHAFLNETAAAAEDPRPTHSAIDAVQQLLTDALPETPCVLAAPHQPHTAQTEQTALADCPEGDAAAALQARFLGIPDDATSMQLVPVCHPAVQWVQLAMACSSVRRRALFSDELRLVCAVYANTMRAAYEAARCTLPTPPPVWVPPLPGLDLDATAARTAATWAAAVRAWVDAVPRHPSRHLPPLWLQGDVQCLAAHRVGRASGVSPQACVTEMCAALQLDGPALQVQHLYALRDHMGLPHLPLQWKTAPGARPTGNGGGGGASVQATHVQYHLVWIDGTGSVRSETVRDKVHSRRARSVNFPVNVLDGTRASLDTQTWLQNTVDRVKGYSAMDTSALETFEAHAIQADDDSRITLLLGRIDDTTLVMVDITWTPAPPTPPARKMCAVQ